MAVVFLLTVLAMFYNILMFYLEGGFNIIISSRLFWLASSFLLFLVQVNIITFGQLLRSISGVKLIRKENEKITDYFKPIVRHITEE